MTAWTRATIPALCLGMALGARDCPGQAGGSAADLTPASLLRQADQALGWGAGATFRVVVEPIGSLGLDQSRLDVRVRARPTERAWQFWIEGDAVLPDGQTHRAVAITTDDSTTRVLDADRRVVVEASGATGVALLHGASVLPAIFWLASWDRLVSEQLIDGGDALVMRYAGARVAHGRVCDLVQVDYTKLDPQLGTLRDLWWFFDRQTHLPVRVEACHFRRDQNAYGYYVLTLEDFDADATLSDADMTLDVPEGYSVETYELPAVDDAAMGGLAVGEAAPDWTLHDAGGQTHSLSEYRGRIVVMDFWATWCGPCVAAMPGLQKVHERFADDPVSVIGLNMSESADPAAFMASKGLTYALMVESDDVASAYEVDGIPSIWVVGPDGKVLFRQSGFSPDLDAKLETVIERALRSMPGRGDGAEADTSGDGVQGTAGGPGQ